MALSLLRCCSKLNSSFNFTQLVLNQNVVLNRFCGTRLRGTLTEGRFYSSQRKPKVLVFGFTNPILWFRTRIYYFLIRAYFDKDFSIKEFTEGATQVGENPGILDPDGDSMRLNDPVRFCRWFGPGVLSLSGLLSCVRAAVSVSVRSSGGTRGWRCESEPDPRWQNLFISIQFIYSNSF